VNFVFHPWQLLAAILAGRVNYVQPFVCKKAFLLGNIDEDLPVLADRDLFLTGFS
jgi:hypothetical protein